MLCFASPKPSPDSVTPMFDVFKIDGHGEAVLLEAVESLDAAIARVIALRESARVDYLVVSRITGQKISFLATGGIQRS
jgi:hypothetical protein